MANPYPTKVLVSGGFDPLHIGHVRMFKEAKMLGDELIVLVNNDNWLMKKKNFVFMPQEDRVEIIASLKCVDRVFLTNHKPDTDDMSICEELKQFHPDIFANGGDRTIGNIPEYDLCGMENIQMVFNVGGGKIRSSSEIVKGIK